MTTASIGPIRAQAPARPGWTLVLAALGLFMTALDNMVVTTALPVIRVSLHSSLTTLEWTLNAYILSFACFLLTGAALGDRFGRRRMFCLGLGVFTAASAAAALAPGAGVLIAARAVQGAGAAMVLPLTVTLISDAFPTGKRAMAIGIWGGIAGLAAAGGPVVGGAVVGSLSWHWIFWLNVPVGIIVIPLSRWRLRESYGARPRLDVAGLGLSGAGFLTLTWGLVRASAVGWTSAEVAGPLIAGVALVVLFARWEHVARVPMLPLALFRRARFTTANGASFFMYAGLFGTLFLMAQFFQTAQHDSPLQAGVRLLPWTAAAMITSPIAGKLAGIYGNRPFIVAGQVLQAAGLGWVAAIATARVGYTGLGLALGVAGTGIGLITPTVATEIVASVPPGDIGVANGASSALRQLGGVFGVAVLAAVFARPGVYLSPTTFVAGFRDAVWVGAGLSVAGAVVAASVILRPGEERAPADDVTGRGPATPLMTAGRRTAS